MIIPINPLILNFCKPMATLPIKTKMGEVALINEAKLLDTFSSATVVKPFAIINIKIEKIS